MALLRLRHCFLLNKFFNLFFYRHFAFMLIMVFILDLGRWGILLQTGPFSKNSWKNSSPLFISCYNFSFSIGFGAKTSSSYSSTIVWGIICTSSFEFEITTTYGVGVAIEVVVVLKKLKAASNSSSNSLLLCSYSKILISSIVGARKASGST